MGKVFSFWARPRHFVGFLYITSPELKASFYMNEGIVEHPFPIRVAFFLTFARSITAANSSFKKQGAENQILNKLSLISSSK